ncbi:MAG: hypothetical protein DRO01_02100 [Thermoproteota archaeon]|nr:MAG: hypothetical protein DRO01_02100 [Candidatus Korarchaeota archaeon]
MPSITSRIVDFRDDTSSRKATIEIQLKKCRHILDEHVGKRVTTWRSRMKIKKNLINRYLSDGQKDFSKHEELIGEINRYLLDSAEWSAFFPQYIQTTEAVISLEKSSVKFKRESVLFLCKNGLQIVAVDKKKKSKSEKQLTFNIITAYFPVKVTKRDSDYQLFLRSYTHLKRKYTEKSVVDNKHGFRRNIEECRFVSSEHWRKPLSVDEYRV